MRQCAEHFQLFFLPRSGWMCSRIYRKDFTLALDTMSTARQYLLSFLLFFAVFSISYLLIGGVKFYDAILIQLIVLWVICEAWYFLLWNMSQILLWRVDNKVLEQIEHFAKSVEKWNRRLSVSLLLMPHVLYAFFYFISKSPDFNDKYPFNDGFFLSSYLSCIALYVIALFFRLPPISIVAWIRSGFSEAVFPIRDDD